MQRSKSLQKEISQENHWHQRSEKVCETTSEIYEMLHVPLRQMLHIQSLSGAYQIGTQFK